MGNNSLPPPPPPGGPLEPPQRPHGSPPPAPPVPLAPPAPQSPPPPPPHSLPPQGPQAPLPPPAPYAPTQAVDLTQPMPAAFAPVPGPTKSRAPLVLVALVLAFGLGVGAYFVFKKDDKKVAAPSRTTVPQVVETTPETFVITAPPDTQPSLTTPDTASTGTDPIPPDITVTDDTKFFTVQLPGDFKTDTKPADANGTSLAQVSGSKDLTAYNSGHDEPGVTVFGGAADTLQAPADLVNIFDSPTDCATRNQVSGYATKLGPAEVLYIDGCGPNKSSKVVMSLQATGTPDVFVVIAQGPGPANGPLLAFAQAVLETIQPA
jgi:hypothetical protein